MKIYSLGTKYLVCLQSYLVAITKRYKEAMNLKIVILLSAE